MRFPTNDVILYNYNGISLDAEKGIEPKVKNAACTLERFFCSVNNNLFTDAKEMLLNSRGRLASVHIRSKYALKDKHVLLKKEKGKEKGKGNGKGKAKQERFVGYTLGEMRSATASPTYYLCLKAKKYTNRFQKEHLIEEIEDLKRELSCVGRNS